MSIFSRCGHGRGVMTATVMSVLLCLIPAGAIAAPSGTHKAGALEASCPNYFFYGSRGSGEKATAATSRHSDPRYGLGKRVARAYSLWRRTLPKSVTVQTGYNPYPAASTKVLVPTAGQVSLFAMGNVGAAIRDYYRGHGKKQGYRPYAASIEAGTLNVIVSVVRMHRNCPNTRFVLSGYSQGAMVVHQAEQELRYRPAGALIAGTILIADGDRFDKTRTAHFGTAKPLASGLRVYLKHSLHLKDSVMPPALDVPLPSFTVVDVCDKGDVVCDFSARNVGSMKRAKKGRQNPHRSLPVGNQKARSDQVRRALSLKGDEQGTQSTR